MQTARTNPGGASAVNEDGSIPSDTALPRSKQELLAQHNAARARLDSASDLIDLVLALLALTKIGLVDLDELSDEVAAFKRAVEAHKRRRA